MDFEVYLMAVAAEKKAHPSLRIGQACLNVLDAVHPFLATRVTGSRYDPFYAETYEQCGPFLDYVCMRWDDPTLSAKVAK
jgi:hypothetical protein